MKTQPLLLLSISLLMISTGHAQAFYPPQAKIENLQTVTERHQAERKALREQQNAERLEIRMMHQKEMEELLQKQKYERRSAVHR